MQKYIQIFISELLIFISIFGYIIPVQAYWSDIVGPNMAPTSPAEYITCPTDHEVTDAELAEIIAITIDELIAMKQARSLTNATICQLPKSRIARALKKTKDSSKPSIEGFMEWRSSQLGSDASGSINDVNANNVNTERQSLVVNDGLSVLGSFQSLAPGNIDKTRWFPLGPNNVSGRIITMFIDPDYPDTLWAGSAGGGLWKSVDNGNNWNPVADFPGNTAVSVITMDPHDHNIMYIGTGDRDTGRVPGNGIFKSTDRGTTWNHIASTSIVQNDAWKTVTDIYIDPTTPGRFISSSYGGSGTLISEDDMQTWHSIIDGNLAKSLSINESPYLSGYIIIPNYWNDTTQTFVNAISTDYGQTFTESTFPSSGYRTEIAFGKPNIITVSGENLSPTNTRITLQNNKNISAHIDSISIQVRNTNLSSSGTLCMRPVGSTDSCSSYGGQTIDNTGGLIIFSGSSLISSDIPGSSGSIELELFFDSVFLMSPGDISFEVDHVDYTSNGQSQQDIYIHGQSFGSGIIYASVAENMGTLYRSIDMGISWEVVNNPSLPNSYRDDGYGETSLLGNQGGYGNTIWVNPFDARHIIIGGINLFESHDGGYHWNILSDWTVGFSAAANQYTSPHADHHSIVSDPRFDNTTNRRIYFGTDGGIYRSDDISNTDAHTGWEFAGNGLNITQFYSIAGTGNIVGGGAQDNSTTIYVGGSNKKWSQWLASGDGMDSAVDPRGGFIYGASYYGGFLSRGKIENNVVTPEFIGYLSGGTTFQDENAGWVMPTILDPNNPSRMYAGASSLWVSNNIDTTNASEVIFTNVGNPEYMNTNPIDIITVAQKDSSRIWVSKYNKLYRSMSGVTVSEELQDWQKITASNLPQDRKITHIEIDYYDPNKVYITYGGYEGSNVWMTENNGVSWVDISANLPKAPVYTIKQYRNNPEYLYVGTEVGLFLSEDEGQTWSTTNEGPANTPVFDIEWYNDTTLLIATFGRGAYALDLNHLTIVPPPTTIVSGEVSYSSSGVLSIASYKNSIQIEARGNQTIFYTLDGSTPVATSPGTLQGGIFTLSGRTVLDPGGQIYSLSGDTVTLKVRSRDFANNWSDVNTYIYNYKNQISGLTNFSFSGGNILQDISSPLVANTAVSESGSIVELHIEGSTFSGAVIRNPGTATEFTAIDTIATIDQEGSMRIDGLDMSIFPDGPIYIDWLLSDTLGNSTSGAIMLQKNTIASNPILTLTDGSGGIYQGNVYYTKVNSGINAKIQTNEIANITLSGNLMTSIQILNSTPGTNTGTYIINTNISLSGSDGVRQFSLVASDMGGNSDAISSGTIIYDTLAPNLILSNYSSGMQQTLGYFSLQGTIQDISPVSATINGINVPINNGIFNMDVLVQMGGNMYTIVAKDILGNTIQRILSVEGYQLSVGSITAGPGGGGGSTSSYAVPPVHGVSYQTKTSLTYESLQKVDSIRTLVRQHISAHSDMTKNVVEPIVAILEGSTLSRTDKNMIYLRVTLSMTREIVALPRGSVERTNLITARQAILSKRKSFIQSIFSR